MKAGKKSTAGKEALLGSEMFRMLFEKMPDAVIIIDRKGTLLEGNEMAEKLSGYRKSELMGKNIIASFPILDAKTKALVIKKLALHFSGKGIQPFEIEVRRKDGRTVPLEINPRIIDYMGSKTDLIILRDITERKKKEEALRERVEKLRLKAKQLAITAKEKEDILNSINDGFLVLDKNWIYTYFNKQGAKMVGMSKKDLIGKCVWDIFPHAKDTKFYKFYNESVKTNKSLTFEEYYPEPLFKWLECHCYPASTGLSVYFTDITERKKAEEELHKASQYARNLIESSLDPLVTISKEGKITDVNVATEKATGISREKMIGTDFSSYFTEPKKAINGYNIAFKQGSMTDYPLSIRNKSGEVIDVLYNASVYRDEKGKTIGVFAAARDITERKIMENDLKKKVQ
ncbi:PAS domain S-box protein [bacterium]|nr:PAS domain S-box protein [bacterium]